jgi:hypothetical protein
MIAPQVDVAPFHEQALPAGDAGGTRAAHARTMSLMVMGVRA